MTRPSDIPPPLPTPGESLTAQFRDWEKRGRGWQLWNEHAFLEPPFRPFIHVYIPPAQIDDGRQHTLASSFIERMRGLWTPKPPQESLDPALVALLQEPEVPPYKDDEDLVEFQIVLPAAAKVSHDAFNSFLHALAFCASPLSFEVIGTAKETTIQIVAREGDSGEVREQLLAYFPEATVRVVSKFLYQLWMEEPEHPAALAEFGLSEEFMRPLRTLSTGVDPLVAVTGALANLEEGEIGVLQVLFESVRHPWAESIFRAATNGEGGAFYEDAPEMVGFARRKIAAPLYAAVIRVAAKSQSEDRAWQIARKLGGALTELDHPTVNELIPLDNGGYDPVEHEVDLILRLTHRSGMILNSDELVSLVHLPTAAVRAKKLKRHAAKTKRAPKLAFGHETILGINTHEDEDVSVSLSTDQRVRHMHVLGAPGTGKSTFLENLVLQDIAAGHGVAVLDPHGDLIEQILERVKEERRGDVILFDPSDEEYPVGFNILSAHSEIEKNLLSSDLVGVFRRLSTAWGDQMTSVLGNAILAMLESEQGGTLADLRRFLIEKSYREEFLKSVKDPQVVYYWKKEFPLLSGGKSLGPLLTRLDTFLRPKLIRHVVAQRENKLDFRKIMDEGKIFLAKLSQGAIGEENAWLLGSLLVSKFHQIALARQDVREEGRRPFFMFVDEFHNFVTPSMTQILSGARKFRLGLTLANHELRQLGGASSDIGGSVLANPLTRVCFRLGDEDARKLEGGFSFFEAKDFQNLGTGEAIARTERPEFDFNLATSPLSQVTRDEGQASAEETRKRSREQYGTPRAEIEAELQRQSRMDEEGGEEKPKTKAEREPRKKAEARKEEQPSAAQTPPDDEARTDGTQVPPEPTTSEAESVVVPDSPESSAATETAASPKSEAPPTYADAVRDQAVKSPESPQKPNARAESQSADPPSLGRGSARHKALQKQFALWARGMGWRADIESNIAGTSQAVDLHLEKSGTRVACEFPLTSTVKDEIKNIRKCLAAGYPHVAVVTEDASRLSKIEAAAHEEISGADLARVRFFTPPAFRNFIDELERTLPSSPTGVMGWKRKRFVVPSDGDAKPGAADDIHGMIHDDLSKKLSKKKKKGGKS